VVVQINAFHRFDANNLMNKLCPTNVPSANTDIQGNYLSEQTTQQLRGYVSNYVQKSVDTLNLYLTGTNQIEQLHDIEHLEFLDRQLRKQRFNDRTKIVAVAGGDTKKVELAEANEGLEASVARWFEENETRIESLTELKATKIAYIVPSVGSDKTCNGDETCENMKHMLHEIHHQMTEIFTQFKKVYATQVSNPTNAVNYPAYVAMTNILNIFTTKDYLNTQDVLNEYNVNRYVFLDGLPAVSHLLDLAMEAPEETIEHAHETGIGGYSIIAQPGEAIAYEGTEQELPAVGFEFDFTPDLDYEHDMDALLVKEGLFVAGNLSPFPTHNHTTLAAPHKGVRQAKVQKQATAKAKKVQAKTPTTGKSPGVHPAGQHGKDFVKPALPKP